MAPTSPRPGWRRLLQSLRSDIRGEVDDAAGALVAWLGVRAMTPLIPDGLLPAYAHPSVDVRALAFGLGVAVLAG
jgi:hypothetical protein